MVDVLGIDVYEAGQVGERITIMGSAYLSTFYVVLNYHIKLGMEIVSEDARLSLFLKKSSLSG